MKTSTLIKHLRSVHCMDAVKYVGLSADELVALHERDHAPSTRYVEWQHGHRAAGRE